MRWSETADGSRRVLVVVCDIGEDPIASVTQAVVDSGIRAAQVTAVGGLRSAELGYFDPEKLEYQTIPVTEQVEVLSLIGDVAERDDQPELHVHAVLGRRDGSTIGGHLLRGQVWPTLETIVTQAAPTLVKRVDPSTGLALLSP